MGFPDERGGAGQVATYAARRWYTRIRGALRSLGHVLARNTIKRILLEHGLEPAPTRGTRMAWGTFLKAHLGSIAATDSTMLGRRNTSASTIRTPHPTRSPMAPAWQASAGAEAKTPFERMTILILAFSAMTGSLTTCESKILSPGCNACVSFLPIKKALSI